MKMYLPNVIVFLFVSHRMCLLYCLIKLFVYKPPCLSVLSWEIFSLKHRNKHNNGVVLQTIQGFQGQSDPPPPPPPTSALCSKLGGAGGKTAARFAYYSGMDTAAR